MRLIGPALDRFRADCAALGVTAPIAAAVSGGPDSLALMLLAHTAFGDRLTVLTVDHGLRAASADEARTVARMCAARGIGHVTLAVSVDGRGGLQAAARDARYAAMRDWCVGHGVGALLTAHHADDQAETVLMRLVRGAGVGGLAGVRPLRELAPGLRLVRPLLGWRRVELAAIVDGAGLVAVDDPANRDPRHDRTRARFLIAETAWVDPARLAASAAHLADAETALDWATEVLAAERITHVDGVTALDPAGLPRELLRRLALAALARHGVDADGPSAAMLIGRLSGGETATLGTIVARPGRRWTFTASPPRRAGT